MAEPRLQILVLNQISPKGLQRLPADLPRFRDYQPRAAQS